MSKRKDQMRRLTAMDLALVLVARAPGGYRRRDILNHPAWTGEFGWPASPDITTITTAGRDLEDRGLVERSTTRWWITAKGRRHAAAITDELDYQTRCLATRS